MNLKFELETILLFIQNRIFRFRPEIWYTSDWHFGHKRVIVYCARPFADKKRLDQAVKIDRGGGPGAYELAGKLINDDEVEYMNRALVRRWNAMVKPNDFVRFLGDFSMNTKKMSQWAPQLNGHKLLIPGNHDKPFFSNKDDAKFRLAGFKIVKEKLMPWTIGVYRVLLSHLPYATAEAKKYDTRYFEHRPIPGMLGETVLLHGHQHNAYLKNGNMIDVGIDHNFRLFSTKDIIKIIEDPREFIPGRLTRERNPHGESKNS